MDNFCDLNNFKTFLNDQILDNLNIHEKYTEADF